MIERLWWDYMMGEVKHGRLTEAYVMACAKESKFKPPYL